MQLTIARLWNGTDAEPDEVVGLSLQPGADAFTVRVDAPFHDDPPPPRPPGPCERLWEHEVVELFVLGDDERYLEVELGPRGHHLVLQLAGRRRAYARALPLGFSARVAGTRWRGEASIPWAWVPTGALRGNAYAIHGQGESRRYLAWAPVPGDAPDFHRLEHFPSLPLARP